MTHPIDDLPAYLAGDLDAAEQRRIEAHLETCAACRAELARLEEAYVALVESLPAEEPPAHVWERIERRVAAASPDRSVARPDRGAGPQAVERTPRDARPGREVRTPAPPAGRAAPPPGRRAPVRAGLWTSLALAASLVVAAVGVLWGVDQRQAFEALQAEQTEITRFLAREGVTARTLPIGSTQYAGTVLFGPGDRALVVMRDAPPPRQSYQAWGIAEGAVTSLGVIDARALEVPTGAFEQIAVSLEPAGGSASPTNVLGGVPTS